MDREIKETLDRLENCFGLNIQGSELNRINALHFAEETELSEDMYDILQLSKELYAESDGAFDPSLLKVSELWGFAPTAKSGYRVPEFYEIAIALSTCDFSKIILQEQGRKLSKNDNTTLDLGGIAKGYIVDKIHEIALKYDATGLVNLGGNIYSIGKSDIGIADPDNSQTYMGKIKLTDTSICTSGDYERYFVVDGKRYHHILGKDGYPVDNGIRSVTVIGDSSAICDGVSTAVFAGGHEMAQKLADTYSVGIIILTQNCSVYRYGAVDSFVVTNNNYHIEL